MLERTTGIILRTRPYLETSLIVQWLTRDFGRISTLARGTRRPKSPFRGKLDLYFQGEITFKRSRRSTLHTLNEISLCNLNTHLRTSPTLLQQMTYAVRLIELATETDSPVPEVYDLLIEFTSHLGNTAQGPVLVLAFETRFLDDIGLAPPADDPTLSPAASSILRQLRQASWETLNCLRLSTAQYNQISHYLGMFIAQHLGKIPLGRSEALLSDQY